MNDNTEFPQDFDESFHQELRDDMKRLASNTATPTTNAWEAIMEESNNRSRRVSRRTQLISAAAAAVVIVAITGAAIAVTSNGDDKTIKTVDKKKNENVSTSTIPAAPTEAELLREVNLAIATIKQNTIPDVGPSTMVSDISIVDGSTNKTLFSLPNDKSDDGGEYDVDLRINRISGNHIAGSRYIQCDQPIGNFSVDISTGKATNTGLVTRTYSPSGNKYAEVSSTCDNAPTSAFIVDAATGNKRELASETINGTETSINAIFWVNENRIIYSTVGNYFYKVADLTGRVSIKDDPQVKGIGVDGQVVDAMESKGKSYVLVFTGQDGPDTFSVVNLEDGSLLWTHQLEVGEVWGKMGLVFGSSPKRVLGSITRTNGETAYIYDADHNITLRPNAFAALPKS